MRREGGGEGKHEGAGRRGRQGSGGVGKQGNRMKKWMKRTDEQNASLSPKHFDLCASPITRQWALNESMKKIDDC